MVATLWLLLVLSGSHGVSVVKFEDEAQCLAAKTVIERNLSGGRLRPQLHADRLRRDRSERVISIVTARKGVPCKACKPRSCFS